MAERQGEKLTISKIKGFAYRGAARVDQHGREVYDRDVRRDSELPGFGVRIFPTGVKSLIHSSRVEGSKRQISIGRFETLTLDEARKRTRKVAVEIVDGKDPLLERRKKLAEKTTFQALIDK